MHSDLRKQFATTTLPPAPPPGVGRAGRRRTAFTIIEILVVVALVLVLMSILLVALNAAARTAQRTNTTGLLNALKQGLVQFERDIGYLPPVLGRTPGGAPSNIDQFRDYKLPPVPGSNQYDTEIQDWFSITSLADFLLGYGSGPLPSSATLVNDDGFDGLGIRSPGPDGYWGVARSVPAGLPGSPSPGTVAARRAVINHAQHGQRFREGQVFGPYLQLRDARLLGAIVGINPNGTPRIAFPGENDFETNPHAPKVIVDYWGEPIRYYRKPYQPGGPAQGYRPRPHDPTFRQPALSDVIVLRAWNITDVNAVTSPILDSANDPTASRLLHSASFGLLSSGPDRRLNQNFRQDFPQNGAATDEVNRDNIAEVGP
ncbi:MAG TPA: hypothetical protein PK400_00160 [Phycisphaerales bacterium]|nr:hypothetical protein [Phycisphaerales bacterium]HRQ75172.1 hypothetical protein [Phycisphaerales bacterium]